MPMSNEDGALVEFYTEAVQNQAKTRAEGRPIYDEHEFVKISVPGDQRTQVVRKVRESDKERFPKAYRAYQNSVETPETGTPLKEWNGISQSQFKELSHANVTTVEALAQVSDNNLSKFGPGYHQLRDNARKYLASSKDEAAATAWMHERDKMLEENDLLKERIKAMEDAAKKSDEPAKRGPGRPPKQDNTDEGKSE